MNFKSIIISCMLMSLCSCAGCPPKGKGVTFNDISNINQALPDSYKNRSIWSDPSIIKYKLTGLVGYVIQKKDQNSNFERTISRIVPNDYTLQVEQIPADVAKIYYSIIDSNFKVSANAALPIIQATCQVETNQVMELIITDKCMIYIPDEILPIEDLIRIAQTDNPNHYKRCWVQAVMLTEVMKKNYTHVSSDSTVTGTTFAVGGKVYNNNSSSGFQSEPVITMLLVDLDELKLQVENNATVRSNIRNNTPLDRRFKKDFYKKIQDKILLKQNIRLSKDFKKQLEK